MSRDYTKHDWASGLIRNSMKRVIYLSTEECEQLDMLIGNILWADKHTGPYTPTNDEVELLAKIRKQTKS